MPAHPEYERLAASRAGLRSTAATNLPVVEEDTSSGDVAVLYRRFREEFGSSEIPGILKCFATHPPLLRSMIDLAQSFLFTDGHLTRRHKEMIAGFISARNECPYCADSHGYFLRVHGGSQETLCALQQNDLHSPALTAAEQELLRFSARVNAASHTIHPDDVQRMRQAGWSEPQIAQAVHMVALFAMFNRVANAFGLQSQGLLALSHEETARS